MRATAVKIAKVVNVAGMPCDLTASSFISAVQLYYDLHGVWPKTLYIQLEDMAVAEAILDGSQWRDVTYVVDDPPQFKGWGVGNSYDHLVGSEG